MNTKVFSVLIMSVLFTAIGLVCGWYGAARTLGGAAAHDDHDDHADQDLVQVVLNELGRAGRPLEERVVFEVLLRYSLACAQVVLRHAHSAV